MNSLERQLSKIEKVLNTDKILDSETTAQTIKDYYRINSLAYSIHSRGGFIHMGISDGEKFSKEDLKAAAEFVDSYIEDDTEQVLELAMGKGANSAFLADKNPQVKFYGLDLTEKHVKKAEKAAKNRENFISAQGDFHDLSRYSEDQFDIVFIIEALCYSNNKNDVLSEVSNVLKPGGLFVIFDGYTSRPREELDEKELKAQRLAEKGMQVDKIEYYGQFKENISKSSFEIVKEKDITQNVLPTLDRFKSWADKFFNRPYFARVLSTVLPLTFVQNAVSGALLAPLVRENIASYQITVLRNKS